jgi:hypothetical protein
MKPEDIQQKTPTKHSEQKKSEKKSEKIKKQAQKRHKSLCIRGAQTVQEPHTEAKN